MFTGKKHNFMNWFSIWIRNMHAVFCAVVAVVVSNIKYSSFSTATVFFFFHLLRLLINSLQQLRTNARCIGPNLSSHKNWIIPYDPQTKEMPYITLLTDFPRSPFFFSLRESVMNAHIYCFKFNITAKPHGMECKRWLQQYTAPFSFRFCWFCVRASERARARAHKEWIGN